MRVISYSEARNNLKSLLDKVAEDADIAVISRRGAEDAVVMSLEYYNALQETLHLLKSPANVEHLKESIAQYRGGRIEARPFCDE